MTRFWVVGGDYADTGFREFRPGKREERFGPYASYREAYEVWQRHARATIDDATVRYRIVTDDVPKTPG